MVFITKLRINKAELQTKKLKKKTKKQKKAKKNLFYFYVGEAYLVTDLQKNRQTNKQKKTAATTTTTFFFKAFYKIPPF